MNNSYLGAIPWSQSLARLRDSDLLAGGGCVTVGFPGLPAPPPGMRLVMLASE